MKNTRVTKICSICGLPYKVKLYRADKSKCCSRACWSHRNPPTQKNCLHCGKEFVSPDKKVRFCSRSCGRKSLTGEKSTNWKGGNSTQTIRGKLKGELKKWRESVYARDNYTCQKCHKTHCEINAHHINPISKYPELALDISNGITLCIECHEIIHNKKLHHYRRLISNPGNASVIL